MVTEYEQLLQDMLVERKARLEELRGRRGKGKEMEALLSEIRFVEIELQRYQQGMSLFRSKGLPKVGRWGRPEAEEKRESETS